ncbi:MAG: four helix bundle protein [Candidatus Levyibacteriota bacterium]
MTDRFENLLVFKESHKLTLLVYRTVRRFPTYERFGVISQLTRAASSVTANIIEGNARNHKKEFLQFLYLAYGSLEETKYFLLLSKDLDYLTPKEYDSVHEQC